MKKLLSFALVASAFLSLSAQKIIGYIPQYRTTQVMDQSIEWEKMTDYYYFGSLPTAAGGITIEQPTRFQHVRNKASQYNKKVWLCVGGWGKSGNFITVARNATARQAFADEALRLCQLYGLEGIDIDWEFPAYGQENDFKEFLKTLYQTLNPAGYLVSAACGGEATHADKWLAETFNYIDDLNIMSYDAPTSVASEHASLQFMKDAMDIYHNQGCPYEKMLGGIAFYSRCAGVLMYNQILNGVGANNKQQTFLNDNTGGYCYNGKNTITNKIDYVMQKGGIGVLIWEVTQDVKGQYSLLNACSEAMEPYLCDAPKPTFTSSPNICGLPSVTLDGDVSTASGLSFTWKKDDQVLINKSSTANTYQATSAGNYILEVHKGNCFSSSSVEVTGVLNTPSLGGPYELCDQTSVDLDAQISGRSIQWYLNNTPISGANNSTLEAKKGGTYKVAVSASGCGSVEATAVVNSDLPFAENDTVCLPGMNAELLATEDVSWYISENSNSPMETGDVFEPTVTNDVTYWMSPTGSPLTNYDFLDNMTDAGWGRNGANYYGRKLVVASELAINSIKVDAVSGGSVTVNLRPAGSSVQQAIKTVTANVSVGSNTITLNWQNIQPGEYYLDADGTTIQMTLKNTPSSDFELPGIISSDAVGYVNWGSAYSALANAAFFYDMVVTAGRECARVPVSVVIDENNMEACLTVSAQTIDVNNLQVYPNPSNSNFNIALQEQAIVSVYDIKGQIIQSENVLPGIYNFGDNLTPGVYFVTYQSKDEVSSLRIVKK